MNAIAYSRPALPSPSSGPDLTREGVTREDPAAEGCGEGGPGEGVACAEGVERAASRTL